MKFIIGNKIYDTENAKEIFKYREKVWNKYHNPFIGQDFSMSKWKGVTLYLTSKGNWFAVRENEYHEEVECISKTEEDVKNTFSNLNQIDLYNKYFSTLEEA
jgi:hypothetical protein